MSPDIIIIDAYAAYARKYVTYANILLLPYVNLTAYKKCDGDIITDRII